MGGFGSGRYLRPARRPRVESACPLDVRKLCREELLRPGPAFVRVWRCDGREIQRAMLLPDSDAVTVLRGGKPAEVLRLERTSCHYGRERPWFLCPACSQRCALVYDVAGIFACRRCNGLKHQTTQESRGNRLVLKAKRLGARIGGYGVFPDSFTGKPRGMHWTTYQRLEEKASAAWCAGLEEWNDELQRLTAGLGSRSSRLPVSLAG